MIAPDIVDLVPGQLLYWPEWMLENKADELFSVLYSDVCWRQDSMKLFGQVHTLPRLQAWFGDAGTEYQYSGLKLEPEPWPSVLHTLREQISQQAGVSFNSVLVNLYRTGRDSNGWHADDEPELGSEPVIASLSLGAVRRFRLRNIADKKRTLSFDLKPGSLLVMGKGVQEHWQHQLAKTSRPVKSRINLTFRHIMT